MEDETNFGGVVIYVRRIGRVVGSSPNMDNNSPILFMTSVRE
jgi:hypothetical protein